jgi:hypothetical protein
MGLINDVKIIEVERKLWNDRHAYVYSDTGIWMYTLEHRNDEDFHSSWKDDADYIDNVRSDFLNEAGKDGQEIFTTELFQRTAEVLFLEECTKYFYQKDQRTMVDYVEVLPELLASETVILISS